MFIDYLQNLPASYGNALVAPAPYRLRFQSRILVISVLIFACLIPRALIAFRLSSICPDGVLYINLAQALKEGHLRQAFQTMNLNVYPAVLAILSRLGCGWEVGGAIWGVLMSCLVVLPLFAWVRRQFDDTVAFTACLLYAVHPVFIQWSPELIRDPTFWFLSALSLCLIWRFVVEVSIGLSLAAGLALSLAVATRFEGLLLLIPLGIWSFWRFRALESRRHKTVLAIAAVLAIIAFPAAVLLVNCTLLRHYPQWVFVRSDPLSFVRHWWNGLFISALPNADGVDIIAQPYLPFGRMIVIYVPALVKGLSPLFALLMLGGMWKWRRVWARRDHQAIFCCGLAVMLAAWIHAWCARSSCDRYFLPMVIFGSPFAALGLLWLSSRVLALAGHFQRRAIAKPAVAFAPALMVVCVGWCTAFSGPYDRRAAEVELAGWVQRQYGPAPLIYGSEGVTAVVAYYAKARWDTLAINMDDDTVLTQVSQLNPDVILISSTRSKHLADTRQLIDKIENLQYIEVPRSALPRGTDDTLAVLCRTEVKSPGDAKTCEKTVSRK